MTILPWESTSISSSVAGVALAIVIAAAAPLAAAEPTAAAAEGLTLDLGKGLTMQCAKIPAGTFLMGSTEAEKARSSDEGPQHEVVISRPFFMGIHPVTQEQYERIMGENPSRTKGPSHPVEHVSWDMAVAFCQRLAAETGRTVRLPTEAEFEYATRAGTTTRYFYGDDPASKQLDDYAWTYKNCKLDIHPVGRKKPNPWGLYDVYGNVWQWCSDWYGDYPAAKQTDPQGPATGDVHVLRGGCWLVGHHTMDDKVGRMMSRSALRGTPGYYRWGRPNPGAGRIGFRVVVDDKAP